MAWTPADTGLRVIEEVVFGNGVFVATGLNTSGVAASVVSSDGATWSAPQAAADGGTVSARCFFAGALFFMRSTVLYKSSDGLTWTAIGAIGSAQIEAVGHNGTIYCAVSDNVIEHASYTSPDGVTWTPHTFTLNASPRFYAARLVAVGALFVLSTGDGLTTTSPDGAVWTDGAVIGSSLTISGASLLGGEALFVCTDGSQVVLLARSADATEWSVTAVGIPGFLGFGATVIVTDGFATTFGAVDDGVDLVDSIAQTSDFSTWFPGPAPIAPARAAVGNSRVVVTRQTGVVTGLLHWSATPLEQDGPVAVPPFWTGYVNTYELP